MSMTIKALPRGRVLHVNAEGEFTLESAMLTFLEIVNAVNEHQSEKVLFDGTGLVGEPTIIERFYYGEFAADAVKGIVEAPDNVTVPAFAFVLLPPVLDPARLGETVAVNRGMKVKAFDNMPEAMAWLGIKDLEI